MIMAAGHIFGTGRKCEFIGLVLKLWYNTFYSSTVPRKVYGSFQKYVGLERRLYTLSQ